MFPQNIFRIGPKNYSFDVNTGFLLQMIEHQSERSNIYMRVCKSIELKNFSSTSRDIIFSSLEFLRALEPIKISPLLSIDTTDGIRRGEKVLDTGKPISIPVGKGALGRMMNVIGEPIDGVGPIESDSLSPIHKSAPSFQEQSTKTEVFETGRTTEEHFEII